MTVQKVKEITKFIINFLLFLGNESVGNRKIEKRLK
jgi:hypothetical protein